jgi:hypothetical protein
MTWHRYRLLSLLPDWLRAATGLGTGLILTIFTVALPLLFYIGLALTMLFLAFAATAVLRQCTSVGVDGHGVAARRACLGSLGLGRWGDARIGWSEMRDIRLRYFSTRRDRSKGWMQLRMSAPGKRLTVDSAIDDFSRLVTSVTDGALAHGLSLDPITLANVDALRGGSVGRGSRGELAE